MDVVIVYESVFGNTREVAEAVAEGVRSADAGADVVLLPIGEATPERVAGAELLVVGGPTHLRGMSSHRSRHMGVEAAHRSEESHGGHVDTEPGAEGPGLRDWFEDLPKGAGNTRAAAFDTRVSARLAGGAAHGISRRLRRRGFDVVADEGFVVEGDDVPHLREGELDRARAWGAQLPRQRSG